MLIIFITGGGVLDPVGILLGFATVYSVRALKKPIKRAAVIATSHVFGAVDKSKESLYNMKEGVEDIIAEVYYENLKRNQLILNEEKKEERDDIFN